MPGGGDAERAYLELLAPRVAEERCRRDLARYAALLERWAAVHNLVRFATREELVERHLLDALAGARHLGAAGRLVDVGSGAGLPGVPLLIARPGWNGLLLEPRHKRWAFLRTVVRELGLSAQVRASRFEEVGADAGGWDVICARALGGYRELLGWSRERLAPGGRVLLWLSAADAAALAREETGWRVVSSALPGLERGRLTELQPCFT